ncbi:septum formation protein Maf [Halobacteriovorax marinus]|uniref:dTTP/UTP pyrophosphatase n=1 Tax=Halobacteriovorax marinus TaxID=97084 RepID=A0A1Y5FGR4_9BACT|nr:septum formation protein Maf [Halobacteriovorax marinus]
MTSNNLYNLILASGSPRRKELLGWIGVPFEVISSDVEEVTSEVDPVAVAEDLAALKGRDVLSKLSQRSDFSKTYFPFIVASDTIVTLGEKIYGKPSGPEGARKMLLELEGKEHSVVTSIFMSCFDFEESKMKEMVFSCRSEVTFEKIDKDLLDLYIKSEESLDKAGSYGIQGQGLSFISNLNGSYSNVVGFPLSDFLREFKKFLGHANSVHGEWRELFHV